MKHGHWFLNRPSFCFPIDRDVGALIQRLRLEATVFQRPNPTQYGRHTPHLSKQKKHIMISAAIMANWFDLVQCAVDFYLLWPYRSVSQPRSASQRACVSVCVPTQTNRGLGQRAWSSARPLIGIYILRESLISISLIICLLSVSLSADIISQLFLIWCSHFHWCCLKVG